MCEEWLDEQIEDIRGVFHQDDIRWAHAVELTAKAETFSRIKNGSLIFGSTPHEALSAREEIPEGRYMDLNSIRMDAIREWLDHERECDRNATL